MQVGAVDNATKSTGQSMNSTAICVPVDVAEYPLFLEQCREALRIASNNTEGIAFECLTSNTSQECIEMLLQGQAVLAKLDQTHIFQANEEHGLVPIVAEYYGNDPRVDYYATAVVRRELCDANTGLTFKDLEGTRSCHTGYRRMAGWSAPIGFLVQTDVIPMQNRYPGINTDAESVVSFFSQTCAVGEGYAFIGDGPDSKTEEWSELCTACVGNCSDNSPYSDYEGAVRGLMDDVCDVAFTRDTAAPAVVADGTEPASWSSLSGDDLRLVCSDGGCKSIDQWETCHVVKIPPQAFVGSKDLHTTVVGDSVKRALVQAGENEAFLQAARDIDGSKSYLLRSKTKGLRVSISIDCLLNICVHHISLFETDACLQAVPVNESVLDFLGESAVLAYKGIKQLDEYPIETGTSLGTSAPVGLVYLAVFLWWAV